MNNFKPLLLLSLLGIAVFGNALFNPYYFDDYLILHNNAWLFEPRPFRWFFSAFFDSNFIFTGYRPTLMATFWANSQLLGESPAAFRAINILLHITNALLAVELIRRLQKKKKIDFMAWSIGALFLLHPLQTLGVNFIWKRSSLLEATFLLAGLILHVRERTRGKSYRPGMILIQIFIFFLAFTTKESAIIFPILLFAIDAIFFKYAWQLYVPLLLEALAFLWFRLHFIEKQIASKVVHFPDLRSGGFEHFYWSTLDVIKSYVFLWLAPAPRLFEDPGPLSQFPWRAAAIVGGLVILTLISFIFRREKPLLPFFALLFWIGLAPTTGRREILFVMDSIRLYLPLIGLCGILFLFVDATTKRIHQSSKPLMALLIALYALISILQNHRYGDPRLIWQDVVEEYPDSGIAHGSLASYFAATSDFADAAKEYAVAYRLEPLRFGYRIDEWDTRLKSGESPSAISKEIDQTKLGSIDIVAKTKLAGVIETVGDKRRAESLLLEVVAENSSYGLAHLRLAQFWERNGNPTQARLAYKNALRLMPNHPAAKAGVLSRGNPVAKSPKTFK